MDSAITINSIVNVLAVLITVGGGITVLCKGLKSVNEIHDRMQVWDKNTKDIEQTEEKIKLAHEHAQKSLERIQQETNDKIEESYSQTEAKIQEVRAEQEIITYCMLAVLDGLHQLHCNGKVTEATDKLSKYLNERAHE